MTPGDPLVADDPNLLVHGRARSMVSVAELVAEVFEQATGEAKAHLLEPLLQPLGLMSLFGIAGGAFARARLHPGWRELRVRPEDIVSVRPVDVSALVAFVQQVSTEAIDRLAAILSTSAAYSGSAAAALLAALFLARRRAASAPMSDPLALQAIGS
jgi:hypothetical protein